MYVLQPTSVVNVGEISMYVLQLASVLSVREIMKRRGVSVGQISQIIERRGLGEQ